tara:strand:+ start:2103 stop:4367 length:2265 start_codon:yes stop_codon:yes gene_type:complete
MKVFWMVLLATVVFAATMVRAEPAIVQSGEHATFSRLVTTLPKGTRWNVRQNGPEVTLELQGFDGGFATERVFDYIPRDRIADLRQSGGKLVLTLNCNCGVSAFVDQERFVVLDIASPGVTLSTPFIVNQATLNNRLALAGGKPDGRNPTTQNDLSSRGPRPLARGPISTEESLALRDMQDQLIRELSLATTRGMLKPAYDLPDLQNRQSQIDVSSLPMPAADFEEAWEGPQRMGFGSNMRISSSLDGLDTRSATDQEDAPGAGVCISDATVDLARWGDDRPFHSQVGSARQALYGEFDTLDRSAAQHLARIYLSFGFGAEAIQILTLENPLRPEDQVLVDLAEILEWGHASNPEFLTRMTGCLGDAALWALLANAELDTGIDIEPEAALRALNKLPPHLRQILAPQLAGRLRKYGDIQGAENAMRSLTRLPEHLPPAARLAQAQLAIEQGYNDKATTQLRAVAEENTKESPEALIALVEVNLKDNQPIDTKTAELVAAYAKELKGSEIGDELRRAHVLALVKSGQFDAAFSTNVALGGDLDGEPANDLRLVLLSELTQNADDIVFLDHALKFSDRDVARLDLDKKLALTQRLLDLGFAEASQRVLATAPPRPRNAQRQLLAAQIAIALQQPFKARAELIGLDGADANQLRAEASEMAGAHDQAYAHYRESNDSEDAMRAAWLAEDWDSEALVSSPVFGSVARLSRTLRGTGSGLDGMLARSSATLEESSKARAALAALLATPELQLNAEKEAE